MPDTPVEQVILWPSAENYPRFREVCGPSVCDTYDEFVAQAGQVADGLERQGLVVRKIDFDPDDMAQWCMENFGKINSTARAAFVAMVALDEGSDPTSG